jgi:hypothetical protein
VTPGRGQHHPDDSFLCWSCGGRGQKLRSSRRLLVIGQVEDGKAPSRVCECPDCGGTGRAEAAA